MNIPKIISLLRNRVKQFSDDSHFTDEQLYTEAVLKRNKFQSQRFRKHYNIADDLKAVFCTPMEIANSHDCDCVRVGCKVVKSKYQIPSTLTGRNREQIRVYTLDYKEIFKVSPQEQKTNQLDDVKAGEITYSILNRKIILWNTDIDVERDVFIKGILVEGVWEDETEWEGITLCDEDIDLNSVENCFNLETTKFAIDADLLDYVIDEATSNLLNIPMRIVTDMTNDASDDIKA